jgi:hypothetical protein
MSTGSPITVQARVQLQPRQAGSRDALDLLVRIVRLRHHLAEAEQPRGVLAHQTDDEIVFDALRQRTHHREVDARRIHAIEDAPRIEGHVRRRRLAGSQPRQEVGTSAHILRGVVGVDDLQNRSRYSLVSQSVTVVS